MPRKKNYVAAGAREAGSNGCEPANETQQDEQVRSASVDVDIDLVELLGADARFSSSPRRIVLSAGLKRGIDDWVIASANAIRSLLIAGAATATAIGYKDSMLRFFDYLTAGATPAGLANSRPAKPADLKPLHVEQFIVWIKSKAQSEGWAKSSVRSWYQGVKSALLAMFGLGLINGASHQFFRRGVFGGGDGESRITAFSDAEQERLAAAIKIDLSAIHHGRLKVTMRELQALRLLVVAHRAGYNATPLLELARDAMKPGLLPGTVLLRTVKFRSKKIVSQAARAASAARQVPPKEFGEDYLPFSLTEGAVIGQAIASTQHLVARASKRLMNRVWLFETPQNVRHGVLKGDVSALTYYTLVTSVQALVKRHRLVGDDGKPLVVNTSRFRKSRFDRAFRIAEGDLAITANLMGNTPRVAGANYPSMNLARQVEAAGFMSEDYIGLMRSRGGQAAEPSSTRMAQGDAQKPHTVIEIKPVVSVQVPTPVAGCGDAINGQHAPKDGSLCDRFVMCLFCSSFAIVGTVDELWRLFSFQTFARAELEYLEEHLGPIPAGQERREDLEDLRDRYRLAIPYIDSFTQRQFASSRVARAKAKTSLGLHPFWQLQMLVSRRGRSADLG